MAKGIKKTSAVKKKLITDLTISSVDSGDRGAGDGCRIELIKRDPLLTAIDRAFASTAPSRNRSLTAPAARALTGGRPDCGRSSTRGSGRFDGTPCGRPIRPTTGRVFPRAAIPRTSRAATPSPIATVPAGSGRTPRRTWLRPRAALSPAPLEGPSDRRSPTARQRYERMQKAADAQRRDGETDTMALNRWIRDTREGRAAYAEDRHAALTEACKAYRRGSREAAERIAEASSVFARVPDDDGGRFPLTGRGDVNTYALFGELFANLASPRGRAGVIVPTGIATDSTTAPFFGALVAAPAAEIRRPGVRRPQHLASLCRVVRREPRPSQTCPRDRTGDRVSFPRGRGRQAGPPRRIAGPRRSDPAGGPPR